MATFNTEKVTDRITRIFAFSTELMYLIEGEDKAALIDTGSGFGSLKACVDALTDKPVSVLITHGHIDHAMGADEFTQVYMNLDDTYIYKEHGDTEFRKDGLSMFDPALGITEADMIPTMDLSKMQDLKEGNRFNLGGISVEIYACPGHTRGSVVMLIPEERILITGDACNPGTFLFEDYSTSVCEYEESLRTLLAKTKGHYDRILLSHADGEGYLELIEDVIAVCEDIKNGNTDDIPFEFKGKTGVLAKDRTTHGGKGNIIYNKDNIYPSTSHKGE